MSTTPALWPMPASSAPDGGALAANCFRCALEDLYEQCSLHMTEYRASSALVGRRPSVSRIRAYSASVRPSSAKGWGSPGEASAHATVSTAVTQYLPFASGAPLGVAFPRRPSLAPQSRRRRAPSAHSCHDPR